MNSFCSRHERRLGNCRAGKADVTRERGASRLACFLAAGWGVGPAWDASDGRSPKRLRCVQCVAGAVTMMWPVAKRTDRARCDAFASHHNTVVNGEEKRDAVALSEQGEGEGPARTSKSLAE